MIIQRKKRVEPHTRPDRFFFSSSPSLTSLYLRVEIAFFIKTRRDALDFHRPATLLNPCIYNKVNFYLFIYPAHSLLFLFPLDYRF